jgi:hypothetical protein
MTRRLFEISIRSERPLFENKAPSEDGNFEAKPTPSETNSSSYFGIVRIAAYEPKKIHVSDRNLRTYPNKSVICSSLSLHQAV